jgi:hypothetical protein
LDEHRLIYRLPKPGPDGRTQLMLSPLELIEPIAAFGSAAAPTPAPLLRLPAIRLLSRKRSTNSISAYPGE